MLQREIDPAQARRHREVRGPCSPATSRGDLDDDVFRVFRLNNGIYGQRQGGHNQMVRVKVPYGSHHARAARHAWATSPTRTPAAGATSRPARTSSSTSSSSSSVPAVHARARRRRPHHPRGVRRHRAQRAGLPPRRRLPVRVPRHHAVGRGRVPALPPPPARPAAAPQVQDQLLRLRDRLRPGDVQRRRRRRGHPHARRRHRSSPASGCSSPAASAPTRTLRSPSRSSPPARTCWPRSRRSCACSTNHGNRDNKLRARMKWLVDTMGWEELQRRIIKERRVPARLVHRGRAASRKSSQKVGDAPAGTHATITPTPIGQGTPVQHPLARRPTSAGNRRTSCAATPRAPCRPSPTPKLGDITSDQFRALAADPARARRSTCASPTARTSCSAASPRSSCRSCSTGSTTIGMAEPGAELARDVVACPGADTCNLAVTQSPRPGRRHRRARSRRRAWPTSAASAPTSPAARTRAASTTSPTSASSAPSAAPTASRRPATRCCSAATSARRRSTSARRRCACRPRTRPKPPSASCAGSPTSAKPARSSAAWLDRAGGAKAVAADLKELDEFPTPEEAPEYYVDYGETGPVRGRDRRVGVRDMSARTEPAQRRLPHVHRRGAGRAQPRVRAPARRRRSSSGRSTTFAPHLCLTASMTDAVLIDLAVKVDPGHRGRLHRHRLPLPRDARDGRAGPPPLRAQPADDDRRPAGRGAVEGRPRELLLGGEGRPARPRARRQGGVDERAAARRGRDSRTRRRSSPATSAGWSRSTRSRRGPTWTWPATSPTTTSRSTR